MNTIVNIRLKNENYAIIDFEVGPSLTVPKMLVYEMGIRKGDGLSEEAIVALQKENEFHSCENKALGYLSRRLHSSMELRRKLMQKGFPKETIEQIVLKMRSLKYLDDRKYAELLVNESINLRHEGTQKIRARLMEKGISKEIIQEVLTIGEVASFEDENIKLIVDKKLFTLKNRFTDNKAVTQKLTAYLLSKGFAYQTIRNYLRNTDQDSDLDGD